MLTTRATNRLRITSGLHSLQLQAEFGTSLREPVTDLQTHQILLVFYRGCQSKDAASQKHHETSELSWETFRNFQIS